MQTVHRDADVAPVPRVYRNRPSSPTFNTPRQEQLCDVIYLVDADSDAREEMLAFLAALDMKVISFESSREYLNFDRKDAAACVILNISLPDLGGRELPRRLAEKADPPVIFISNDCDIACTVSAMKAGAIDFFTKPFDLQALIASVRMAFAQDRKSRQRKAELAKLQERFSLLTPREREVLPLVVGGLLNKQRLLFSGSLKSRCRSIEAR